MSLRDPNVLNPKAPKRIALVIANPAVSSTTGWPVGFWWSELTHPYYALTEAGYEVELFSPAGGRCEADGMSDPRDPSGYSASDLISMGFIATPRLAALIESTRPVADLKVDAFDAIVVAGGQAPMFSFAEAADLHRAFVAFYEAGKVAAALCHGVALLRYVRLGRTVGDEVEAAAGADPLAQPGGGVGQHQHRRLQAILEARVVLPRVDPDQLAQERGLELGRQRRRRGRLGWWRRRRLARGRRRARRGRGRR